MPARASIAAAILTACAAPAAAGGTDTAVARVVACAVAQVSAVHASATAADRAVAERRVEALRGLVPRAALAAGADEAGARDALAVAWQAVETRSATLSPPGMGSPARPVGCEALADDPEAYLAGIRRR